jgi:MFS family permease
MGLSLVGLACYHYYHEDLRGTRGTLIGWLPVVAIMVYIVANSIGLGPVSGIIIGELVPQRHRSIASSITGAMSWLSAFIVTKTFLDLRSILNLHGALWLYGSLCLIGVPFVHFFLPETRGISQYGIEVLFKANRDHSNGVTETKMGQDKSLMVLQVHTKKTSICDECST